MSDMNGAGVDDPGLRAAMAAFLAAAEWLDHADGVDERELLDLAERKAVAGLALRKRLTELGWTAPTGSRAGQPAAH